MKIPILLFTCAFATCLVAEEKSARDYFSNVSEDPLELKSSGKIAFGPAGMLLISDPRAAAVVAVDTGDRGPLVPFQSKIPNVEKEIGALLKSDSILVVDMAVNHQSGAVYFSVTQQPGNRPALVRLSGNGVFSHVDVSKMDHVRMNLSAEENSKLRNVTDLAWGKDSVIVAGQSSTEFANKIFQIPAPLRDGVNADFFSAETYHVAHRRWETKAPIQSFIPWEEDGEFYIVGAFACTPIAKFPISDIESGTKITGTSVVELGSGNRPRDMFTYQKDGEEWLVTNTLRFKENSFGPSKYWAARVKLEYLDADSPDEINENAPRRNVKAASGPDAKGMEVVEELFGAVVVTQLDNEKVIVLREIAGEEFHSLELVSLP